MCTLVLANGVFADHPLVAIANRDEQDGRASTPPFAWKDRFFAPKDEVAGGTWLGLNEHGVFVAITNRFVGPRDPARVSRGSIVVDALRGRSAAEIHAAMAKRDPARHNGFHLVYADARDALATVSDGDSLAQLVLGRGLHVITERSFAAGDDSKRVARVLRRFADATRDGYDEAKLTTVLAEHDPDDLLASTCVHVPELHYGTKSGMVLDVGGERMLWAEGPPCTTPFVPTRVAFDEKTG